jgi:hypothetical protein
VSEDVFAFRNMERLLIFLRWNGGPNLDASLLANAWRGGITGRSWIDDRPVRIGLGVERALGPRFAPVLSLSNAQQAEKQER